MPIPVYGQAEQKTVPEANMISDNIRVISRPRRASSPTLRPAAVLIATVGLALPAAGCGGAASSASTGNTSSSGGHPTEAQAQDQLQRDLLSFARCMRSHAVSSFPDPTSPGAAKQFVLGQIPGVNTQSSAFQSAHTACRHLLPGRASAPQSATMQAMAQLLRTSRCMRSHGLAGFPDPTTAPPSNQGAYLDIAGFSANHAPPGAPPVAYLSIPNSINPNSPAAERAATACGFRLH